MSIGNLLTAGAYVTPIPLGIPITLRYDANGKFEKLTIGTKFRKGPVSNNTKFLQSELIKDSKIPLHINITTGTTIVRGVVYTGLEYSTVGRIPECYEEPIIQSIKHGDSYNVFAAHLESTAVNYSGQAQINAALKAAGFSVLPGLVVPFDNAKKSIDSVMSNSSFVGVPISEYFQVSNNGFEVKSENLIQDKLGEIVIYLDNGGCVWTHIDTELDKTLYLPYYEYSAWQLHTDDEVILDSSSAIQSVNHKSEEPVPTSYTCPICGKMYEVTEDNPKCPNDHCMSVKYNDALHLLNRLNLPNISYANYMQYVEVGKLNSLGDILSLSEYRDAQIETTLFDLLDAVIPVSKVRNRDAIWAFYSKCNSSYDSMSHYMHNPQSIKDDLSIEDDQLVNWFSDNLNILEFETVVQYANVYITAKTGKYNFAPILRNQKIYLTGKFNHGSYSEIEAIIEGYNGSVVSSFEDCTSVVVGDIPEDVNGYAINYAKAYTKLVFTESNFFKEYEIDQDLIGY